MCRSKRRVQLDVLGVRLSHVGKIEQHLPAKAARADASRPEPPGVSRSSSALTAAAWSSERKRRPLRCPAIRG